MYSISTCSHPSTRMGKAGRQWIHLHPGDELPHLIRFSVTCTYSAVQSLSWKAVMSLPCFCRARSFNTVFTKSSHWILFWDTSIQSHHSHPILVRSISLSPFRLYLCLPRSILFRNPIEIVCAFLKCVLHAVPT